MKVSVNQELRKAKSLTKKGQLSKAREIYQRILESFPSNKQAIEGLTNLGNPAVHASLHPPKETMDQLISFYNQGLYDAALNRAIELSRNFPNAFLVWNTLGAACQKLGRNQDAINAFTKVIETNPGHPDGYNNLGTALKQKGNLKEAISAYEKAITLEPDHAEAYNNLGNVYQLVGHHQEAILAYNNAIKIKPGYAEAFNNLGSSLKDIGKYDEAEDAYNKSLQLHPNYAEALFNKGKNCQEQGIIEQAITYYQKAIDIKPMYPEAFNNLGSAFQDAGRLEKARSAYEQAIRLNPDYAMAYQHLSALKTFNSEDPQIPKLKQLNENPDTNEIDKCHISYALAKAHEDLGQLEEAFYYLKSGGALRKQALNYRIDQDEALFESIKSSAKLIKQQSIFPETAQSTPIFILGMPRSGTTLIEQIISCHSQVLGAGELDYLSVLGADIIEQKVAINSSNLVSIREKYFDSTNRLSTGYKYITDKQPQNFLYIALIAAAFPEAKIIHVTRQAAAVCWSNFKNFFSSDGLGYSYNLGDTVKYYKLYENLMGFFSELYGSLIYEVNYDDLVVDQENHTRNLIEHIGLDWEDECLSPHLNMRIVQTASNQQVRQKVYTGSSAEWKKFEPYLEGVFDTLL